MNDRRPLIEYKDHFTIQTEGHIVTRCCIDYALTIECQSNASLLSFRISERFRFIWNQNQEDVYVEKDPTKVGAVFSILHRQLESAHAKKDGSLILTFAQGHELYVSSSPTYEAWECSNASGLLVVGKPGGGLAVWGG